MKILLTCFFLSTVGLTTAGPFFLDPSKGDYNNLIPQESNELQALLQTLVSAESAQDPEEDSDDGGDNGIAFLEGMFNVLAQVDEEKAKATNDESANIQFIFWSRFGKLLSRTVGKFVSQRYCPKQHETIVLPKDIHIGYEQEVSNEDGRDRKEEEDKAFAELKTTFGTLRKLNSMKSKGLLRNFMSYFNRGIRRIARKYFC